VAGDAWQQAEPSLHDGGLTVFSGASFALTDAWGNMRAEPQGFFVSDRRAVHRMRLRVRDHEMVVLRSGLHDDDTAQVVRRLRSHEAGPDAAPLLLSTTLQVHPGSLRMTLLFRNSGREARTLHWALAVGADFADIFAVKEGRAEGVPADVTAVVVGDRLELSRDGMLTVVQPQETGPVVTTDGIAEDLDLPPRSTVERVIDVDVLRDGAAAAAPLSSGGRALHRPQLSTRSDVLAAAIAHCFDDLEALRIHDPVTGSDTVAAGAPWFMTLFGRDSLITAMMAAPFDQSLGLQVLRSLARRQGTVVDPISEEEPGRILHETRMSADTSLFEGNRTRYYGSTDATPLFVVALGELARAGMDRAAVEELMPAADLALGWIEKFGDLDGDGYVESVRRSDAGLVNQGWKDSWNAIVGHDGEVVDPPIALIEVQAYVHAALRTRGQLARMLDESSGATFDARASRLRAAIDRDFWLPDLGTYALGLARGRPIRSSTSNAGHMLWTGAAMPERVAPLAGTLMSRRLRTHWGLRTLASDHAAYDPLGYHTGSIWPHDTALVAWGLSRWGLGGPAAEIASSLLRTASYFGGALPELVSGLDVGDPVAGGGPVRFPTACSPQAWAAASPLLLLRSVLGLEIDRSRRVLHLNPSVPESWLPLTLHQIRSGGERLLVRTKSSGEAQVVGLPEDFVLVRGPLFVD
jgi:glycogen debranching enzyme